MDAPGNGTRRTKWQRARRFEKTELRGRLGLRNEAGRRAVVVARVGHAVRVELEPVAEVEERRPVEMAIGLEGPLVAGAVDPELVARAETARVREQDAADREGPEAELVRREDDPHPAHGLAAMPDPELARDDQDVARLALGQLREHLDRPAVLAQVLLVDLAVAPVLERPGLGELAEHVLHGAAVLHGRVLFLGADQPRDDLELRNGEVAVAARRNRRQRLEVLHRAAERQAREQRDERVHLLADRTDGELRGVAVLGGLLLVGELVRVGQLREERREALLELASAIVEPLSAVVRELRLVVRLGAQTQRVRPLGIAGSNERPVGCGHLRPPPAMRSQTDGLPYPGPCVPETR